MASCLTDGLENPFRIASLTVNHEALVSLPVIGGKRKMERWRGIAERYRWKPRGRNKFSSHNDTIKVSCGSVHTISRGQRGAEGGS